MVGNDIVDIELAKAQSNWQRPRYLEKLFTSHEQELIHASNEPTILIWQFWSMKEAAYKLYTQLYPTRFYNPKAFECSFKKGGIVEYKTFKCHVKTKINSKYIISETQFNQGKVCSKVVDLKEISPKSQSEFLKNQLLTMVSLKVNCDNKNLKFVKDKYGIPTLLYKTNMLNISLSHHGRFGTIAFAN